MSWSISKHFIRMFLGCYWLAVYKSQKLSLILNIQNVWNLLLVIIVYLIIESWRRFLLQDYFLCNSISLRILSNFSFCILFAYFEFYKIFCALPVAFERNCFQQDIFWSNWISGECTHVFVKTEKLCYKWTIVWRKIFLWCYAQSKSFATINIFSNCFHSSVEIIAIFTD